jgi:gluconolactonase
MNAWVRFPLAVVLGLAFSLTAIPDASAEKKILKTGKLIPEVAQFHRLVPRDAKIEIVVGGHVWTEGPAWVKDGGYLLFSDIPRNSVYKWQEGKGESLFLKPSGYTGKEKRENEDGSDEPGSNGLVVTPDGKRLVLCQHGDRKVAVTPLKNPGKFTYLAEKYQGKRLNSPNDAVFHSSGVLFFTDPPYGLKKRYDDPARELDFCGVYKVTTDGKVELLTKEMTRPNGIALSRDEKTLYVSQSDREAAIWKAFPVRKNLTLGKSKVLMDVTDRIGKMPGAPDGMTIDARGNLFATGPGGVYVFSNKGKFLGLIYTGHRTANCTFGDADGQTLYMATDDYVTRIRLNTRGKGF